jgi:uncharacterized protein (TIGR03435 family)
LGEILADLTIREVTEGFLNHLQKFIAGHILKNAMTLRIAPYAFLLAASCFAQPASRTFDVASVKLSLHPLGKDANSQVAYTPAGLTARNMTLKDLIAEAYQVQPHQIAGGPRWLDVAEYDLEAKADAAASREQLRMMLQALLSDRMRLVLHKDAKQMRVYDLLVDKNGPKIQAVKDGEKSSANSFHGTMRQLANLISIQLTIPVLNDPSVPGRAAGPPPPVLDKTGLSGVYEVNVKFKPELGVDMFTLWQRLLRDQLGLRLDSRNEQVPLLIVDNAEKTPAAN